MIKQPKEKKKIYELLRKDNRGAATIEFLVGFYIMIFLLALFINVLPIFVKKQTIDYIASEAVRMAEVTGRTNSDEVNERMTQLLDTTGITLESTSWEGTEYMAAPNAEKIQINKPIKITLTYKYQLMGNRLADSSDAGVQLTLTSISTGRSEVFTKE